MTHLCLEVPRSAVPIAIERLSRADNGNVPEECGYQHVGIKHEPKPPRHARNFRRPASSARAARRLIASLSNPRSALGVSPEPRFPAKVRDSTGADGTANACASYTRRQASAVPSAVIPAEANYLLDPLHPEFRRIWIGRPRKFETDLRLIRT